MNTFVVIDVVCFIFHFLFLVWSIRYDAVDREDVLDGMFLFFLCLVWPAYVTFMSFFLLYRFFIALWDKYNQENKKNERQKGSCNLTGTFPTNSS